MTAAETASRDARTTTTRPRVAGLDLLRGLAIGLVMAHHAWPDALPGAGVVGVVMFFALSGWLITGLLADELAATGRIGLGRFYLRRARRLVPALVVLLAAYVLVTLTLDPIGDRHRLGRTLLVALTWTGDLGIGGVSPATFHLWTLAVEEQFYLLWPLTLLVLGRRRGLLLAAAGTGLALLGTVGWLRAVPDNAYALPTSWAVCFVVGAGARLGRHRLRRAQRVHPPAWTVPVALLGLAVLSVVPLRGHVLTYLAGGPAIAALTTTLLLSWHTWTDVRGPVLRAVVWLGTVSYAAYLWNYPLTLWLRPHLAPAYAGPLAAGLTLVAAALSWRLVERPLQERWARGRANAVSVAAR